MSLSLDDGFAPRVLVTRPAEDASGLANALGRVGYQPVVVPLLERRWQIDAVIAAVEAHPEIDWVVVTSSTTADVLATAAPGAWRAARWAAVGDATARRLRRLGYSVDLVPDRATAADVVIALGDVRGLRVAYPRADLASPATQHALLAAGAEVIDVVAYDNVAPDGCDERLRRVLPVHATTLLSGSAARRVAEAVAPAQRADLGKIVCIGPSTARVAADVGLAVDAVAHPHSLPGLLDALRAALTGYFSRP